MFYRGPGASGWGVLADILLNAAFWMLIIWAFVAVLGWARRGRGCGHGSWRGAGCGDGLTDGLVAAALKAATTVVMA